MRPRALREHREDGAYANNLRHPNMYEVLYMLPVAMNARICVEVGTEKGVSTAFLAEAMERTGGHVWTIDRDECPFAEEKLDHLGLRDRVTVVRDDGPSHLYEWDGPPVDLYYDDGSHDADDVHDALHAVDGVLAYDGCMVVHDARQPGVQAGVDRFLDTEHMNYSVVALDHEPGFYVLQRGQEGGL